MAVISPVDLRDPVADMELGLIRKAVFAVLLSGLFIVCYGQCNTFTGTRGDVGTYFFEWERLIPTIPALIVPYMSIDIFFFFAPFLCTTRAELATFAKRITVGVLFASLCFLLFPLVYAFERPQVEGVFGPIFTFLHGFDQPYNMSPSLHIILRTVLAHTYARHVHGVLGWGVQFWFFLIGISTLVTGQHHVIDVANGFLVALALFFFIRDPSEETRPSGTANPSIGRYYLAVSVTCLAVGVWVWPAASILLWPALAFGLVGGSYFGYGARLTDKRAGTLPLPTRLVLAPWLWAQKLSLRHYSSQGDAYNIVDDRLWMGRLLTDAEAKEAVRGGVRSVFDLTCEFSENKTFRNGRYYNLQVLDLTAPRLDDLCRVVEAVIRERECGVVYIHCKIGYSRTAAVVGAYLLRTGKADTVDEAVRQLREARPTVVIRPEIRSVLDEYSAVQTLREAN